MQTYFIINKTVGRSKPVFCHVFSIQPHRPFFSWTVVALDAKVPRRDSDGPSEELSDVSESREIVRLAIFGDLRTAISPRVQVPPHAHTKSRMSRRGVDCPGHDHVIGRDIERVESASCKSSSAPTQTVAESRLVAKKRRDWKNRGARVRFPSVFAPRFGWSPQPFSEAQFGLLRGEHITYIWGS